MTEEEIIDYLKKSIEHSEYNFENFGEHNYLDVSTINAISKLLELYNKQKEELETEKHYAKFYEKMVKEYKRICINKNKEIEELKEEIDQINKNKWEDWLENNE